MTSPIRPEEGRKPRASAMERSSATNAGAPKNHPKFTIQNYYPSVPQLQNSANLRQNRQFSYDAVKVL